MMKLPLIKHKIQDNIFFEVYNDILDFPALYVDQIHGESIVDSALIKLDHEELSADGIHFSILNFKDPCAIQTADCMPLVLLGEESGVIVHAGWKGVANNIALSKTVIDLKPTKLIIGPHIRTCCYEVQKDFKEHFLDSNAFITKNGKLYFSLKDELLNRILRVFPNIKIYDDNLCTCCDKRFQSYRREKKSCRNWNVIRRI